MGTVMDLKDTELCLGLPGGGVDPPTSKYSSNGKRGFSETVDLQLNVRQSADETPAAGGHVNLSDTPTAAAAAAKEINSLQLPASSPKDPVKPPAKAQVVGWPPVRSYRKNIMATTSTALQSQKSAATEEAGGGTGAAFVKVSIDGAPYLRKVDLKMYKSYQQLSDALGKMFSAFTMGNYGSGTQGGGTIDFMNESKLMDLLNSSDYVPTYEDKDGDWMLVGDVPWEMFVDSCKRLRIMKGSEAIGLAPRAMEKCKSRS